MRPNLTVDRYRPGDRDALYAVCLRTGDRGQDASAVYERGELLGHLYLGAYLTLEPDLAFVLRPPAEDGESGPVGYVVGTADTPRFEDACEQHWWPALRQRYPADGAYPAKDAELVDLVHAGLRTSGTWLADYPAHLHVDLLPEAQGGGHGRALLETCFTELAARGVPGVHLGVDRANRHAVGFYRHLGMEVLEEGEHHLVLGLRLSGAASADPRGDDRGMPTNLLEPEPTLLPEDHPDTEARAALDAGEAASDVAARLPASSLAWSQLARTALDAGESVAAYAYARTGYHRGLDSLRKAGWRGQGPVPADHLPNQGVLLSIRALGEAAAAIGEDEEALRCRTLLDDCDPHANEVLGR